MVSKLRIIVFFFLHKNEYDISRLKLDQWLLIWDLLLYYAMTKVESN